MAATPKIEHRVGVQAPVEVVWEVIADLEAWAHWNPIYTQASGRIGYGEQLRLTLSLPGHQPRELTPTVIEWIPNEQLHWVEKHKAGLVRSVRYIELEKLSDEGCIFAHGEMWEGFLAVSTVRPVGRSLRDGFEAMSQAIKARAEALWRERSAKAM